METKVFSTTFLLLFSLLLLPSLSFLVHNRHGKRDLAPEVFEVICRYFLLGKSVDGAKQLHIKVVVKCLLLRILSTKAHRLRQCHYIHINWHDDTQIKHTIYIYPTRFACIVKKILNIQIFSLKDVIDRLTLRLRLRTSCNLLLYF